MDPALVGTWESRFETDGGGIVWTWNVRADGGYLWRFRGPIPLPDESGTFAAGKGVFVRSSTDGRVDRGSYVLSREGLTLKTASFEQKWTRK